MGWTVSAHLSKAEHSPPLISCQLVPWHSSPHPLCISESWLIVATTEGSDYSMAKTSMQIPPHFWHRPETTEIDPLNSRANRIIHTLGQLAGTDSVVGRNRFGPYVFVELSPFICCWVYELLLQSRTNESRSVLCCLRYDLLHFWLLWE